MRGKNHNQIDYYPIELLSIPDDVPTDEIDKLSDELEKKYSTTVSSIPRIREEPKSGEEEEAEENKSESLDCYCLGCQQAHERRLDCLDCQQQQ